MIAYSNFLDDAIENSKKIPNGITKSSDLASKYLSRYGLDKSFFEYKLQEQHRLEKECTDIEILSAPSSEIISRIFNAIGELTNKTKYSSSLKKLGFELGKLIYVYDGLLDYQNDSKTRIFNCISACYFTQNKDSRAISEEIFDFIKIAKNNISSILKQIEFNNNTSLIRMILLQDFEISTIKHEKGIMRKLKRNQSSCTTFSNYRLTKQVIYGIITGALAIQPVAAKNYLDNDWIKWSIYLGCGVAYCCICCAFAGSSSPSYTDNRDGGISRR